LVSIKEEPMKKKSLALLLILVLALTTLLAGCGGKTDKGGKKGKSDGDGEKKMKVGFICLHDENSTYDLNFINAANKACEDLGVESVFRMNIPEGQECYDAATELADEGCSIVFADSFGHEDYMMDAAKEFPDVQFCHATGNQAHTAGLENFHNAFASIYEGRYLGGVAAGLKLNEMIEAGDITADEAKLGYVGAFTYAEVISGYTSYFLGARSVCPSATMEVTFTGSWYDETAEKEAANKLMDNKCVIISQHADSMGAPTACEKRGVPNVSYNGSTKEACPNTYLVTTRIDWTPYYKYAIQAVLDGKKIDTDWTGGLEEGSVIVEDLNDAVIAKDTKETLEETKKKIEDGSLQVFDTANFTVDGKPLESYMADVDRDENNTGDTEAIKNGAFMESKFRSAPYFNVEIDGIKLLDTKF
jgi:basic membrane protein A